MNRTKGSRPRWLFLEDDPQLFDIMNTVMEEIWEVRPVSFKTADAMLNWLKAMEKAGDLASVPELALLDVRVPGEAQGSDVARYLRQNPLTRHVVVVLITGYSFGAEFYDPEDELLRPDLMMQKPYPNFEKFKTILLELIAKRRLRFPLPPQDSVPAPPAIVPPPQEKKPPIPEDQPEDERVEPASALKVEKPPGTGELKTVL